MEKPTEYKKHPQWPMTFKEWIFELFQDERDNVSIKPVIAFMGALFLCITMLVNAFIKINMELLDSLVNAVMVITSIGMGADTVDKFSIKHSSSRRSRRNHNEYDEWSGGTTNIEDKRGTEDEI